MSTATSIEWTDATWNPVRGCSRVSPGCVNCYAERQAIRHSRPGGHYEGLVRSTANGPRWTGQMRVVPEKLDEPLRWRGRKRIFVNSMSDLFHEDVPNEVIAAIFGVMAAAPLHTFQVLTKRAERMRDWFQWIGAQGGIYRYIRSIRVDGDRTIPDLFSAVARTEILRGKKVRASNDPWIQVFGSAAVSTSRPIPNVWIGVSAEDLKHGVPRIDILREVPAAVRFLSIEPLLEDVGTLDLRGISWVIVGGESGPGARPLEVSWVRSIVEQCRAAGTACFVKQLGAHVITRNDDGLSGSDDDDWQLDDPCAQVEHNIHGHREDYQGADVRVHLRNRKGGDMSEWPADLRVREFPTQETRP